MQAIEGVLRLIHLEDVGLRRAEEQAAQHPADRAVGEDRHRLVGRQGNDIVERQPCAVRRHDIVLAVRRDVVPAVEPTVGDLARPAALDLRQVQPVPVPPAHLAQAVVVTGIVMDQAGGFGSEGKRLAYAAERTCAHGDGWRLVSGARELLAERHAPGPSLRPTRRRQRRIEVALCALLGIPDGLAVPEEIDRMMQRPQRSTSRFHRLVHSSRCWLIVSQSGCSTSLARSPTGAIFSSGMLTSTLVLTGPLPMSLAMPVCTGAETRVLIISLASGLTFGLATTQAEASRIGAPSFG